MNGCSISTGISVQMVHACCVRLKGNSAYLREEELTESCSRGRAEPSEIMYMNKNSCLITDITAYLDIEISGNYEIFHVPRASACYMLSNDTVDRWWRGTLNENSYWSGHSSFSCDPFYIYMYIYIHAHVFVSWLKRGRPIVVSIHGATLASRNTHFTAAACNFNRT